MPVGQTRPDQTRSGVALHCVALRRREMEEGWKSSWLDVSESSLHVKRGLACIRLFIIIADLPRPLYKRYAGMVMYDLSISLPLMSP
jgi:hypothetical protein